MRCQEVRATKMIELLLAMNIKSANTMTLEEASTMYGRIRRGVESSNDRFSAAQLDLWSRKRRRARQTHPGKRGKR